MNKDIFHRVHFGKNRKLKFVKVCEWLSYYNSEDLLIVDIKVDLVSHC